LKADFFPKILTKSERKLLAYRRFYRSKIEKIGLAHFPRRKKADGLLRNLCARRRLLAYPSFSYIETMQNGKVDFE